MPKKYRKKKPVIIEAIQLGWNTWNEVCDFLTKEAFGGGIYLDENFNVTLKTTAPFIGLYINTLEGKVLAKQGDYIVKGVQGGFYPCKPDVFEMTYEAEEESDDARIIHTVTQIYGFSVEQAKTLLEDSKTRELLLDNVSFRNGGIVKCTIPSIYVSQKVDVNKLAEKLSSNLQKELKNLH